MRRVAKRWLVISRRHAKHPCKALRKTGQETKTLSERMCSWVSEGEGVAGSTRKQWPSLAHEIDLPSITINDGAPPGEDTDAPRATVMQASLKSGGPSSC